LARESIGIGFIGSGWMARAHAHGLRAIDHIAPLAKRIRLVNIASRRPDRVQRVASELGFERWTTRWEEVVEDPEVEVVANLASNDVHAPASIAALELRKPVLCEKPLARDSAEAASVLRVARAADVAHAVGFNYRYVPAVQLARQIVAAGRLGQLRHFRGVYLQDWALSPNRAHGWRFDSSLSGSGAVGDFSHIVDLLRYLAGEPISVVGELGRFIDRRPASDAPDNLLPVDVDDAYGAVLQLRGGALATLEASRLATGWKGRQVVELNGSEGSLWWDMEDLNRLHVFFVADEREGLGGFRDVLVTQPEHPQLRHWWAPGHILGWENTFVHQWLDFLQAMLEQRPVSADQASFLDGYRAAVVCDAILASAKEGRRIQIAVPEEPDA
jgi:predicted dehydrogenase